MIIDKIRWLVPIAFVASSIAAAAETSPPSSSAGSTAPHTEAAPLQPLAPAPKETPPAPTTQAPPPPQAQPIEPPRAATAPRATAPAPAPAPPPGQWVYTRQYGWLWMPYERAYTHVVPDAALAYTFVYYPGFGWRWVVAPWVLGFGVAPYWGPAGPFHFVWYARPWFRVGVPYYPYRGPGWRHPPAVGRAIRVPPRRR